MNERDRQHIAAIGLVAALADGDRNAAEQQQLEQVARDFGGDDFDDVARQILSGQSRLEELVAALSDGEAKQQAYEIAVLVCHADGSANEKEKIFLAELKTSLALDGAGATELDATAAGLAVAPVAGPSLGEGEGGGLDAMILKSAVLAGALELLPQNLASLAIVPLQLRLVYRIGAEHGRRLDATQVKDLAGAMGIGAAAQVMEGVARRVLGGLAKGLFGKAIGGVAGGTAAAVTGVGLTFATTYALGHAAKQYYAQGRTLSRDDLKALFGRLKAEAATIYPRVEAEIRQQASTLNLSQVIGKIRGV
jgi:uncharacterized protein (DUF697 family)/tellurite resistance protein